MYKLAKITILAVVAVFIVACSRSPIIGEKKMARLLADMEIAQSAIDADASTFSSDSMRRALRKAVYDRHGVTVAEVDTSLYWYNHHVDQYAKVLDQTTEILEKRLAKSQAVTGTALAETGKNGNPYINNNAVDGDSVNLWTGRSALRMSANNPVQVIAFDVKRDRYTDPGDIYQLTFRASTRSRLQPRVAVTMAAEYSDMRKPFATASATARVGSTTSVKLETDPETGIQRLYGAITAMNLPADGTPLYIDSISLLRIRHR